MSGSQIHRLHGCRLAALTSKQLQALCAGTLPANAMPFGRRRPASLAHSRAFSRCSRRAPSATASSGLQGLGGKVNAGQTPVSDPRVPSGNAGDLVVFPWRRSPPSRAAPGVPPRGAQGARSFSKSEGRGLAPGTWGQHGRLRRPEDPRPTGADGRLSQHPAARRPQRGRRSMSNRRSIAQRGRDRGQVILGELPVRVGLARTAGRAAAAAGPRSLPVTKHPGGHAEPRGRPSVIRMTTNLTFCCQKQPRGPCAVPCTSP